MRGFIFPIFMTKRDLAIEKLPEFEGHKLVSFIHDAPTGMSGFIAIHRANATMPSFGATRFWRYPSEQAALRDALGLAKTMSYKLAMAGLPYGGAKAVLMASPSALKNRAALLKTYARRVNLLGGRFITGNDVGLNEEDLHIMRRNSPYMVGTKGDVLKFTALGIFYGMSVCLKEVYGSEDTHDRTFAIQGVGNVGTGLLKLLYGVSKKIIVADIDYGKIRAAKRMFPKIEVVKASQIHIQEADVFSPCALSRSITRKKAVELRCKIVAGGANSQLEDKSVGDILHRRGILYAPDYLVNAGGLITVVDEYENKDYNARRVLRRVMTIRKNMQAVINKSKRESRPTHRVADEIAEKNFNGHSA